jgi:hypothetical protein
MNDIEARMECLKIAIENSTYPAAALELAKRLADFVVNGIVTSECASDKSQNGNGKETAQT